MAILATALLVSPRWVLAGEAPPAMVELVVRNAPAGEALRCVLVMAHFVSLEAGRVPSGGELRLTFERTATGGSLILRAADGREMETENLICGAEARWSESRGDVPLLPLREPDRRQVVVTCRVTGRLQCIAGEAE